MEINETENNILTNPPRFTDWPELNQAIYKMSKGLDKKHPVYGLGEKMLFHEDILKRKKKGKEVVSLRIAFPRDTRFEYSYLLNFEPETHDLTIIPEGLCPQLDSGDYVDPYYLAKKNSYNH